MGLVARVRRTIRERALLERGQTVLVAVSGGPDSTALLSVMARVAPELGLRVLAAGIDHGLRAEAAAELDLAAARAAEVGVPFERRRIALEPGDGIQARARHGRYAALAEIAARQGAARVAVGHTQDDQAETVLSRVLRGGGLRGVAAIAPGRTDGIVRPLIDATRAEVRAYLDEHGIPFASDPSNADDRFERVRIRDRLLPALVAEDAHAVAHLAFLADEAREADQALEALALRALADATTPRGISLTVLQGAPAAVGVRALREALGGATLCRAHLSDLRRWLQEPREASEVRLPGGRTARIDGGHVVVSPTHDGDPREEA
ncbi:MAG: tRNA lysidine(34) synthetase TilS [Sandaracinus sp.]